MEKANGAKPPVLWLACGVIGPPVFTVVYFIEGAILPGYNFWRSSISELSLSNQGEFQIANFIICGLLIGCFAVGLLVTQWHGKTRAAAWGLILLALVGVALILSGIFVTDVAQGYLPTTLHGRIHFFSDIAVFVLLSAVYFVFAWHFTSVHRIWAICSVIIGILVLAFFIAFTIASIYGGLAGLFERISISFGMAWIVLWAAWRLPRKIVLSLTVVIVAFTITVIIILSTEKIIPEIWSLIISTCITVLGAVVAIWPLIFPPSDGPGQSRLERIRLEPYFYWNVGLGAGFLLALLVFFAFQLNWIGAAFAAFQPTSTRPVPPTPPPSGTRVVSPTPPPSGTVVVLPTSTPSLWDWLQLLIVPVMLAIGGFWILLSQKRREVQREQNEREAAEKRAQIERDIASDNQREAALQAYLNYMTDKIDEYSLREKDKMHLAETTRARTLLLLRSLTIPRLDADRKASVVKFLYELGLINKDKCIFDLGGADLSGVDLSQADLSRLNLSRTNLTEAILKDVVLTEANLEGANLERANLERANLSGANLSGANLSGTDLSKAKFYLSVDILLKIGDEPFSSGDIIETDVSWAELISARSDRAKFIKTKLPKADLGVKLMRATSVRWKLTRTNLSGANLNKAKLDGATLIRVDLSRANLSEAKLKDATLISVKLKGTDLRRVNGLTKEQLKTFEKEKHAIIDEDATTSSS